jgi:hypothetical protein
MAILDPKGRVVDSQWMVPLLFEWLRDPRFRDVLERRGRATRKGLLVLASLLYESRRSGKPVDPAILRKELLNILQDRPCRIVAARLVLAAEAENYLEDPDNHAPPRTQYEVREELHALRLDLEKQEESENLIVRPY